jgi:hypothetical protein
MTAFYRTTLALLVIACLGLTVASVPASAADVPPTASLPPIFNGTDLTGWNVPAEPYWTVADGVRSWARATNRRRARCSLRRSRMAT